MKKEPGFILLLFSTANQILYQSTWKGIEENDILLSFWSWPPLPQRDPQKESEHVSHSVAPQAPVHGILQARILEWVAISFSRAYPGLKPGLLIAGKFFTVWATREAPPQKEAAK